MLAESSAFGGSPPTIPAPTPLDNPETAASAAEEADGAEEFPEADGGETKLDAVWARKALVEGKVPTK